MRLPRWFGGSRGHRATAEPIEHRCNEPAVREPVISEPVISEPAIGEPASESPYRQADHVEWHRQLRLGVDAAVLEKGVVRTLKAIAECGPIIQAGELASYVLSSAPSVQLGSSLGLVEYNSQRVVRPAYLWVPERSRGWPERWDAFPPFDELRTVRAGTASAWTWALVLFARETFVATLCFERLPGKKIERLQRIPGASHAISATARWEDVHEVTRDIFRALEVSWFARVVNKPAMPLNRSHELDDFVARLPRGLRIMAHQRAAISMDERGQLG